MTKKEKEREKKKKRSRSSSRSAERKDAKKAAAAKAAAAKFPSDYPPEAYEQTLAAIHEQVPETVFEDLPDEHDGWVTAAKFTAGVTLVMLNEVLKKCKLSQTTYTDKGGKVGQPLEHFQ